jgi:hypothetical protein
MWIYTIMNKRFKAHYWEVWINCSDGQLMKPNLIIIARIVSLLAEQDQSPKTKKNVKAPFYFHVWQLGWYLHIIN